MIIPAAFYKEEIVKNSQKIRYSKEYQYYTGTNEHGPIDIITDVDDGGHFQWAIVDKNEKLVGYIAYYVDFYSGNVSRFGLIRFTNDHKAMTNGFMDAIKHIESMNLHRASWYCVDGNPIEKDYDKICQILYKKGWDFNKIRLKDVYRDSSGLYHDSIIYELINYTNY